MPQPSNKTLKTQQDMEALRADMLNRGWDGNVYYGVSKATGRQRKDMSGIFFRNAKTGEFVNVL